MANPVPGTIVPSNSLVTPGGAQGAGGPLGPNGPTVVSADAGNLATLGSDNLILVPQSTLWSMRLRSFNALGNPNSEVDQRNAGNPVTGPAGGTMIIDRWLKGGNGTYSVNCRQYNADSIGTPIIPGTNFRISNQYFRVALTTQETSLAAGDFLAFRQVVEGPQFRELSNDVHSVSLLVGCTSPLKFGLALRDPGTTRTLTKLCTIATANTWTLIPLPNLPVWPGAGNFSMLPGAGGYLLDVTLASGSTWMSPANDAWQTGNFQGAVGQDNFCALPVNSLFMLGFIQHEPGPLCTQFIDKPFSQNLDECLRYYAKSFGYGTAPGSASGQGVRFIVPASCNANCNTPFPRRMAKAPTVVGYSAGTGAINNVRDVNAGADRAISGVNIATEVGFGGFNLSTLNAAVTQYGYDYTADTGW